MNLPYLTAASASGGGNADRTLTNDDSARVRRRPRSTLSSVRTGWKKLGLVRQTVGVADGTICWSTALSRRAVAAQGVLRMSEDDGRS